MRTSVASRVLLVLAVAIALLALPAAAYALPEQEVTGTVVAAGSGAPLGELTVYLTYTFDGMNYNSTSTSTDDEGHYSITPSLGETATAYLYAIDYMNGLYAVERQGPITLGPQDRVGHDFTLSLEAHAPVMQMAIGDSRIIRKANMLPDDFSGYQSDGSLSLWASAQDYSPVYFRDYSQDEGSGIQEMRYQLNGGPWQSITPEDADSVNWWYRRPMWIEKDIELSDEGVWTVRYYAIDRVGNESEPRSLLVAVDRTAPVTTYVVPAKGATTLKLKSADNMTGVAATFVRDLGSYAPLRSIDFTYGTSFKLPVTGSKWVQFYSVDKVGNTESVRTVKVSAPATAVTPKPSTYSVKHTKTFTVTGQVYPRANAKGVLWVYRYTDGDWKLYAKRSFAEGSDYRYHVPMKLPVGSYRFRATYGSNTPSWVNPPVSSAKSKQVHVW